MRRPILSMYALVLLCVPAWAENWADSAGDDPDFAASRAACQKSLTTKLPPRTGMAAKTCDSSALLYGIARPVDAAAARSCALGEMAAGRNATGGAATLATIYANGLGVPRNADFAIAYACRIDGAPAEMDGRIKHLVQLRANGPGPTPFDLCDDVTSGALEGFCAERQGEIADAKRNADLAKLTTSFDRASRAAYDRLRRAEQTFVNASADGEVDVSGTGRGAFIVESRQNHEDAFAKTLHSVLAGSLSAGSIPASDADRRLNAIYAKIMATRDSSAWGTVEKKGIKAAQRAWLGYRDAFLAFGKVAAPPLPPATLAVVLTDARVRDLQSFAE